MTPEEAAAKLDCRPYRDELPKGFQEALTAAGLVAVFGASDDLMEFCGLIYDEIGAYEGVTAHLTPEGLVPGCNDECKHYEKAMARSRTIEALWCPEDVEGDPSWTFKTDIPHATFRILEDGALYCIGIVFRLADATPKEA